jgi:hypothetical protein
MRLSGAPQQTVFHLEYKYRYLHIRNLSDITQYIRSLSNTSGFWPRVRARALSAPVFLGSLTRQMGRCAPPPRPSQLRCSPQN